MHGQVVVQLGHANVAIVALHGDDLAVLRGADGFDEGAEIDVTDVGVVDPDLAVVEAMFVDGGENFFTPFERGGGADGFAFGVGADYAGCGATALWGGGQ